jgi:hypothetical protein
MTLFGAYSSNRLMSFANTWSSTLATDRGFKERVREDMLVRLLDAFVWRNHGHSLPFPFTSRQLTLTAL